MDCNCYTKCGELPNWLGTPHHKPLFQHPKIFLAFMIPYLPRMYNPSCHNINPLCIEIVVSIVGATCERWGGVGWNDWAKHHGFYQCQIENPCEVIKVHELPQNPPMGSLRKRGMIIVSM